MVEAHPAVSRRRKDSTSQQGVGFSYVPIIEKAERVESTGSQSWVWLLPGWDERECLRQRKRRGDALDSLAGFGRRKIGVVGTVPIGLTQFGDNRSLSHCRQRPKLLVVGPIL